MYGDTEVMRGRVAQLREQGDDIRTLADRLVAHTEGIGWSGRAADSMRERIRERSSHLRDAATHHDTAAESLEKHLLEVDRIKDSITGIERTMTSLAAEAPPSAVFVPPPTGHKDWLAVKLPHL